MQTKWEYKAVLHREPIDTNLMGDWQGNMNVLGKAGWEAICVLLAQSGETGWWTILKRPST